MAAPKRKSSKSKTRIRHSHNLKVTKPQISESKESGVFVRWHHVDLVSGYYRGKHVFDSEKLK